MNPARTMGKAVLGPPFSWFVDLVMLRQSGAVTRVISFTVVTPSYILLIPA